MSDRFPGWAAALFVVVLVCAVGGTIASFLIPDFSADINHALVTRPPAQSVTNGMNWCEDCDSINVTAQFAAGSGLALFGLLVVGIPLGISATALTTANRRAAFDRQWGSVFQIGFVFQLGSALLAAAILLLVAAVAIEDYKRAPMFYLMLLGDVVIGAIALPSWRSLQERGLAAALRD